MMAEPKDKRSSGVFCVATGCDQKKSKDGVRFHLFPHNDPSRCEQWRIAAKMKMKPTKSEMLCSDHFKNDDYKSEKLSHLKSDAVPSIFEWSRKTTGRKEPVADEKPVDLKKKRDSSPTKDELKQTNDALRKKVKTLQQTVRREKVKTKTLTGIIKELKDEGFIEKDVSELLKEKFSGLSYEIILNHFNNKDRRAQGHRHSDEAKRFALAIHFYSPRAYEYLKPIFSLPHPRSLSEWTSSVKVRTGIF